MSSQPLFLSSLTNPRVKQAVKLRQRSHRDELHLMLIEGYREIKRAIDNRHFPTELFYCRDFFQGTNEPALMEAARKAGAELFECAPNVFEKIAFRDRPEGLLAIAPQVSVSLENLKIPSPAMVVVAEAVEKPGNLGTILRSADGAGACAVIVCDRCTDINNPNVVRASIGTLFSIPVVECTAEAALDWLAARKFQIVSTTPHTDLLHTEADLAGNIAIVVGTEQYGLSKVWLEKADIKVRIPMLGQADSLNVASATTILLYEAVRQRSRKSDPRAAIPKTC